MENHGLIIRHLRLLAGLSVQLTAEKIGRSKGWISEIENNTGNCKLTESEFNRIVGALKEPNTDRCSRHGLRLTKIVTALPRHTTEQS